MEPRKWKAPRYTSELLNIPGMAFDVHIPDPKARIQAYIDSYDAPDMKGHKGFDEDFMRKHIKLENAWSDGQSAKAVFFLKVVPEYSNRMGNMHGGAMAMIYDMCTTMCAAPLARDDFWVFGGVSRTLSVTYLRPVRSSMDILIECEVLQQGRRLTTIRGQMKDKSDGSLLSVAEHNKASIEFVNPKV
ncbi:HotDog domain-containing protein [Aspergillus pseudoustus]|uniref:HotDog domain-containing protein n=1 Tax=Aspergillus pseudoustus TaxID=1810923 RepID=A0ABR4J265_9EURO